MRVVHVGAGVPIPNGEFVGVDTTGLDGRLGDEGHAILRVRHHQSVPVNGGALREIVGDADTHRVAFGHPNFGTRYDTVEREHLGEFPGLIFPLNDIAGEAKHLHTVDDGMRERLPTLAGGRLRKCDDPFFVHRIHLVGRHVIVVLHRDGRRPMVVTRLAFGGDHDRSSRDRLAFGREHSRAGRHGSHGRDGPSEPATAYPVLAGFFALIRHHHSSSVQLNIRTSYTV